MLCPPSFINRCIYLFHHHFLTIDDIHTLRGFVDSLTSEVEDNLFATLNSSIDSLDAGACVSHLLSLTEATASVSCTDGQLIGFSIGLDSHAATGSNTYELAVFLNHVSNSAIVGRSPSHSAVGKLCCGSLQLLGLLLGCCSPVA